MSGIDAMYDFIPTQCCFGLLKGGVWFKHAIDLPHVATYLLDIIIIDVWQCGSNANPSPSFRMGFANGFSAHFNARLAFSVSLVALSSANYGFDNQGFS